MSPDRADEIARELIIRDWRPFDREELAAALRAYGDEKLEGAAGLADKDVRPECGLPRDWPVEKPCPQCGDIGTFDDANLAKPVKCPGRAGTRIGRRIRSLKSQPIQDKTAS